VTIIATPGAPADVSLSVDGEAAGHGVVGGTVPAAFSATETFDVGIDLGSPVSLEYFERSGFAFEGTIVSMLVELL
jgi:arylsulfatase